MQANRNGWIDLLKAGLIVLVVIGHVIPERMGESPVRQWIYLFHMPAFLALSGYLLSDHRGPSEILVIAWRRYVRPWVIVTFVVLALRFAVEKIVAFSLVRAVLEPWYHLWYIPALLFFSVTFAATRTLGIWVPIVLLSLPMLLINLGFDFLALVGPVDKRIVTFGIFLASGIAVRRFGAQVPGWAYLVLVVSGFAVALAWGPRMPDDWLGLLTKLAISVGLVGSVASIAMRAPSIAWLFASESLAIYLWHAVVVFYLRGTIPYVGLLGYYAIALITSLALLPLAAQSLRQWEIGEMFVGATGKVATRKKQSVPS